MLLLFTDVPITPDAEGGHELRAVPRFDEAVARLEVAARHGVVPAAKLIEAIRRATGA